MVKPFVTTVLTKNNSIETKTKCISAIEALVSKDTKEYANDHNAS